MLEIRIFPILLQLDGEFMAKRILFYKVVGAPFWALAQEPGHAQSAEFFY